MRFERQFKPVWDVAGVRRFFEGRQLPKQLRLDEWTMITDLPAMVAKHIEYIDRNNGNPLFRPYYTRLRQIKKIILENEDKHRGNQ